MLEKEAVWLYRAINELDDNSAFPLLNLGSSTLDFRTRQQPYIDEIIFRPLREARKEVVHTDIKHAEGVDLVGDIFDVAFREEVRRRGFKSVLSSNLLEHVEDPAEFAKLMLELVPSGGYLILSGPFRYPEHLDPIDNGLRPTVSEFHALFPGTRLIVGESYSAGYHFERFKGRPLDAARFLKSAALGLRTREGRRQQSAFLKYEVIPFKVTSVVLRKN